jgi:L-2,4-diaminobutyric acid acetyltransferase
MQTCLEKHVMMNKEKVTLRNPDMHDGEPLWQLVQKCPPLEANTCYAYVLYCTHFADTCLVADNGNGFVGYILGYRPPKQPDTLFVWQIGVSENGRGKRLGQAMLRHLVESLPGVRYLEATVAPSNRASQRLFQRFAQMMEAQCVVKPFFGKTIFGEQGHEAEDLFRIGPF